MGIMGCISNSAKEDSEMHEERNNSNMHTKRICTKSRSENGQIELINMYKYEDIESPRSLYSEHDEKQIEYITPEGLIDDDHLSDFSDDDILKDGAMTMGMIYESSKSIKNEENITYDAMVH